jgi:membrane-anchored glycerophosphoryl diester phosphodiesterase (GDPDase)
MPIPRYEREQQQIASRRFTRAVVKLYAIGGLIGLILGLIWVISGLLHFHPLW